MMSGRGVSHGGNNHSRRTNLIVHHGVTDLFNKTTKFIHVLGAVQEPRGLASFCKWDEVLENTIQFSSNTYASD